MAYEKIKGVEDILAAGSSVGLHFIHPKISEDPESSWGAGMQPEGPRQGLRPGGCSWDTDTFSGVFHTLEYSLLPRRNRLVCNFLSSLFLVQVPFSHVPNSISILRTAQV